MNDLNGKRLVASLQKIIATATTPEKVRRACTLRLSRLRNATTGSRTGSRVAKPLTITTRTKAAPIRPAAPAAPAPPSEAARFEAVQSFHALSLQRSALFRKRRTAGEQSIYLSMACLMPAAVPTTDDAKSWTNFVAQVTEILSEIKNTRP